MNEIYKNAEYCMDFTNEEILQHLVDPLKKFPQLSITFPKSRFAIKDTQENIQNIYFDGDKGNFSMSLFGTQTSIFITDEVAVWDFAFNEEFMFIDDLYKENITSSDTYRNVVYEGSLRNKTHEEILELLYQFVVILMGATAISIEETVVSQIGLQYPKCTYVVNVKKESGMEDQVRIDNILFLINQ